MATPDGQMNQYLTIISTAVKGKDMRSALHDSIEKTYNDSYGWADQAVSTANQANANATTALNTVNQAVSDIPVIRDLAEELQDEYDETAARIDNLIAHNNDTEGNSELIDIRTTFQGSIANSAGGAVRFQARQLNNRMDQIVRTFPTSQVSITSPVTTSRVLLWENPNPTSGLPGFNYTFSADVMANAVNLIIRYKNYKTANAYTEVSVPLYDGVSSECTLQNHEVDANDRLIVLKRNIAVSKGEITVGTASFIYDSQFSLSGNDLTITDPHTTQVTDNDFFVLTHIYAEYHNMSATVSVAKDSEIVDARIGADGVTYNTLGEAIRTQVAQYVDSALIEAINASY